MCNDFTVHISTSCRRVDTLLAHAELDITVGHRPFSDQFDDLAEQIQFARTNLLQHIINGEANNSL